MADGNNIETGVGTAQRVALDLARTIASQASDINQLTRAEWLDLYTECLQATFDRRRAR